MRAPARARAGRALLSALTLSSLRDLCGRLSAVCKLSLVLRTYVVCVYTSRRPILCYTAWSPSWLETLSVTGAGADATFTSFPADGRVAPGESWHFFRCGALRAAPGATPGLSRPCSMPCCACWLELGPAACCAQGAVGTRAGASSCGSCCCCSWGPSAPRGRELVITPCGRELGTGAFMSSSARWCSRAAWR